MKTMKKFLLYLVLFILLYLFIDLMTYLIMKNSQKDIKYYNVEESSYKVEILESKAGYENIFIKGTITNNTDKLKDKVYLKIDFYNENGKLVVTKYKEIEYFNVGEIQKFEENYKVSRVNTFNISVVNEIEGQKEIDGKNQNLNNIINEIEVESKEFKINEETFVKSFLAVAPVLAIWA